MEGISNSEGKRTSGSRPKKRKHQFCKRKSPVFESASSRKLASSENETSDFSGYRILDVFNLTKALKSSVVCKDCQGEVEIVELEVRGLGSNFAIQCTLCEADSKFSSCGMVGQKKNVMEINRRAVYAMRCLGQGLGGLKTFCGVMDLPAPVKQKTYKKIVSRLHKATSTVAEKSMQKAAVEELASYDDATADGIAASFDGTWMKRGHTSLHGVVTCIGGNTGKVIDAAVKSSHCKGCELWKGKRIGKDFETWKADHTESCTANYKGSSGKMEVEGVVDIFQRSQEKRGLRYAEYIGDGDTSSYLGVVKSQPYGPDITIKKVECVGHIQKRMGSRLRKLKQSLVGKKLSDGKSIGGRGRLTDAVILKLTAYYGNAIRQHTTSAEDMRKAIWAIYFHTRSTDEEPSHHFCPKGSESWCGYRKAEVSEEDVNFVHKSTIAAAVMDSIKPIFKDLSAPQLLARCLGGRTQNNNESINGLIWKYCPKVSFSGRNIVEIATNEAIIGFNDGLTGRLEVMRRLECTPGTNSIASAAQGDMTRVKCADRRAQSATFETRRALRAKKLGDNERMVEEEGPTYGAGEF